MSEDVGRISVSRDALRAELATMELRLIEKLATKSDVDDLKRRVVILEKRAQGQDAVDKSVEGAFSRREKLIGLGVALLAVVLQTLAVTGGFHA